MNNKIHEIKTSLPNKNDKSLVLEIKGFNTVSTKADNDDIAISLESPVKKNRKCFITQKEKNYAKLSGKS